MDIINIIDKFLVSEEMGICKSCGRKQKLDNSGLCKDCAKTKQKGSKRKGGGMYV